MTDPLKPIPPVSATPEEIAAVSRDEVIAHAVFHRLYATLAPERAVRALLMADMPALTQCIAEIHTQAYNAGYRTALEEERRRQVEEARTDAVNKEAARLAIDLPSQEQLRERRGE